MRPADFLRAHGIYRQPRTLFLDGASHYDTPWIPKKWTAFEQTNTTWTQAPGEGRNGRGCIKRVTAGAGDGGYLTYTPNRDQDAPWVPTRTGTFGHAVKVDSLATLSGGTIDIPSVFDLRNAILVVYSGPWAMFGVMLNQSGTLTAYTRNQGAVASSVQAMQDAVWAYLEYQWTVSTDASTADGALEIRWNGIPILLYTGILSTGALGFPAPVAQWDSLNVLGMYDASTPSTARQGDVYLNDNVASPDPANPADGFFGDIPILYIRPNGVGASSGWTPSSAPNFSCVNEVPPDDAERITATPVGTRDTYDFEDVVGDPKAIQICLLAKKATPDAASVAVVTRQGGADLDGQNIPIADTDYSYLLQPQDVNPHTTLQWTEAEMNAGQWGPLKTV